MVGYADRFMKGASWIAASRIVVNALGLANIMILALLLTPEDFGIVAIATSISLLATSLTELSMSQSLVHHEKPDKSHFDTAFGLGVLRGAIVAAAVAALGPLVAWIYDDPRLGHLLLAVAASSFITGFWNPKLAVLQRELSFHQEFIMSASDKLAGFLAALTVAVIWQTYWALIVGIVTGQLVAVIVGYLIIPYRPGPSLIRWRELLSFSVWLSLGQAAGALSWRLDQLVVGYVLGPAQAGFVAVGDRLATLPTRETAGPISRTAFPAFSRIREDSDRLRRAYIRVQTIMFAVALPAGVGTALVADPAVRFLMGDSWSGAILVIQVSAVNLAFQTLSGVVNPLYMAIGETKKMFTRQMLVLGIRVPLVVGGLLLAGLPGLLIGRLINGAISVLINAAMVERAIGIRVAEQMGANHRSMLAVAAMSALTLVVGWSMPDGSGTWQLAVKLTTMLATIAMSYPLAMLGVWYLRGRPDGPEREIMDLARRLIAHRAGGRA